VESLVRSHTVIPISKEMHELGYPVESSIRIFDWGVVAESLRPLLERSIPPFDVIS
jgi:hypothetical protein